jgi:hypothetical protein
MHRRRTHEKEGGGGPTETRQNVEQGGEGAKFGIAKQFAYFAHYLGQRSASKFIFQKSFH